jgi:hypothetical protein
MTLAHWTTLTVLSFALSEFSARVRFSSLRRASVAGPDPLAVACKAMKSMSQHLLLSLADLADIHRRQQALKSLVGRRHRRLHESLDHRITRARKDGTDPGLSREEWARLHEEELLYLRGQIADLQLEIVDARVRRTDLKRTLARAKRLKASQGAKSRKQA